MPKVKIDFDILKDWILNYFKRHGKAPRMEDFYKNSGAPYTKSIILKEYGSLKRLYEEVGITPRSIMEDSYKEYLLKELRDAIYTCRTTNYTSLKKEGEISRDRYVYNRVFKSWKNAIQKSGINPTERVLIRYFTNYMGQEPISFLKKEIGLGETFTSKQNELIQRVVDRNLVSTQDMQKDMGYKQIQKNFKYASILQIATGLIPSINYNTGIKYEALDGHDCDSLKEKELDDWLYSNGFYHEVHIPYPNSNMICDFKVRDHYIEYAGLLKSGRKDYEDKISKKIKHCQRQGLHLHIISDLKQTTLDKLKAALLSDY